MGPLTIAVMELAYVSRQDSHIVCRVDYTVGLCNFITCLFAQLHRFNWDRVGDLPSVSLSM